ncbi:MAG: hypothetical protein NT154_22510 [Verrucomicrobia bacterium]|nr:hypothetical protein [Verrucomicrobiota bacterium]
MKDEAMKLQSEDPVPYRCGNEREPHTRTMKFDGSFASVLTWRVVGSIEADSLSWRFITTDGGTVAVRPVQLPSSARPFCVPEAIHSAMRSASDLIDWVHGRCGVKGKPKEIALYEINDFIGRTTGKKLVTVREPAKGGGYTATQRAAILKRLTDPKDSGAARLEAIRAFILHQLFKPEVPEIKTARQDKNTPEEPKTYPPPGSPIRDTDLRRLVEFMGKQIGENMTLPVLLDYNPTMLGMFKGWVAETVEARKIEPKEAEQFLARSVTFIAECEGRRFWHCYPIEDMKSDDVTDQEDRAPHQTLVRHEEAGLLAPLGHATYEKTDKAAKEKGRSPATKEECDRDKQIHERWKRWQADGGRSIDDFAEKHYPTVRKGEIHRAINSHAHRLKRKHLSSQPFVKPT